MARSRMNTGYPICYNEIAGVRPNYMNIKVAAYDMTYLQDYMLYICAVKVFFFFGT